MHARTFVVKKFKQSDSILQPSNIQTLVGHSSFNDRIGVTKRGRWVGWWNGLSLFLGDLFAFLAAAAIGGFAAYYLESQILGIHYVAIEGVYIVQQLTLLACVMLVICGWFLRTGHYTERRPFREDAAAILNALLVGLLISGFVEFAHKTNFSRLWLVLAWMAAGLTIPVTRILVRRALAAAGTWTLKAIIIGRGNHARSVRRLLTANRYLGYSVTTDGALSDYAGNAIGAVASRLNRLMKETGAQRVILVPSDAEIGHLEAIVDALNVLCIPYCVVPPIHKLPLARLATQTFLSCDAVLLTVRAGLASSTSQAVKRIFDVVATSLLLAALLPILLIVSVLTALDGGPVLFAHERIGRGGRVFKCLKFRTMVPGATKALEEMLERCPKVREEWLRTKKLRSDPRMTKVGSLLRVTSIDELPQLFNVLRGDMSLVGPRPVTQEELRDHYKGDNCYYELVRPGITGLWQVSGRNHTDYEQRVHLDSWYVRNWSLWSDVMILLRTLPVVISGTGAY
jgi:Undecaprenyl-phosphate galactose phosphotransferase WbaP